MARAGGRQGLHSLFEKKVKPALARCLGRGAQLRGGQVGHAPPRVLSREGRRCLGAGRRLCAEGPCSPLCDPGPPHTWPGFFVGGVSLVSPPWGVSIAVGPQSPGGRVHGVQA